ncbi:MAG TPA: chemotaxis protein CheB [Verrucomicrobiae bacterium]|nr:chemotaxis protein CheB [Verrucomicrobiae bacterium]
MGRRNRTTRSGKTSGTRHAKVKAAAKDLSSARFPIVGIGASAGGLEAYTHLLQHLPRDTGMGFVLVQHLDPQHKSALTNLLRRVASMPVREVTNNTRVERNHIYVIPPNVNMTIAAGVLKLSARQPATGVHRSIDLFLESLAEDQHERAIGVILSGSATDGTLGLEAIKAEGGITFAQDDSAKWDSMPRSAVGAGCVDFVLSPKMIARELKEIAQHPYVAGAGEEDDAEFHSDAERETNAEESSAAHGKPGWPLVGAEQARPAAPGRGVETGVGQENSFKKIILLLRNHSAVDFSFYKPSTIRRRVTRRMILSKSKTLSEYAAFLKGNAKELDALYSDVLINVTSFFRNADAFDVLRQKVFPKILARASRDEPVRVWVLGCSTGQEAYSIAMAYVEVSEKFPRTPKLQVFATDLNDGLLDKARHGLYAKSLAADIPPERLRRFFVEEQGGYRISKSLREMVVFARQNMISDPPFSRMDLISCRNLLIYLEPSVQRRSLPIFHYALKPEGFLFLGSSESVGPHANLFEVVDKKHKIFAKKPAPTPSINLPVVKFGNPRNERKETLSALAGAVPEVFRREPNAQHEADRVMVNHYAPPGVLVNDALEILQFRGSTRAYLEPPTGKASFNVLKMAREGLMLPLRAALNKAKRENKRVRKDNLKVAQNGNTRVINIEIIPLKNLKERHFLILFLEPSRTGHEEAPAAESGNGNRHSVISKKEESAALAAMERELAETRDYVQSIQEQYEASTEELQASNEEVQSANEELQSVNEELETSKEELESTNEELLTVNDEVANRNADLSRLNGDLANLHINLNMPILLLGRDLIIRRFTPEAEKLFNLMATDVGRPLSGIRHNLDFENLERLITESIDSVSMQQREVRDKEGHWYLLRVRPYMTMDNKIDGAVVVLWDIDPLKRSEQAAKESRDYAEATIRTARDSLVVLRSDLRVNSANDAFYKTFKVKPDQVQGRFIYELGNGPWNNPRLRKLLEDILPRNTFFNDFEVVHEFPAIGRRTMLVSARRLDNEASAPAFILMAIEDVTERLASRLALRHSETRYRRLFEAAQDGVVLVDAATRKITDANPFIEQFLGYTHEEIMGKELWEIGLHKDRETSRVALRDLEKSGDARYEALAIQTKKGQDREVEIVSSLYTENDHSVIQCNVRDITRRREADTALREAQRRLANQAAELEQLVAERTGELTEANTQLETFVYTIAHDLRAPLRAMEGFVAMLVEEAQTTLSDTARNYAGRISRAARFMDALLVDLLAFSRVSQERKELVLVNLEALVQTVLGRLEKEIQERNASIEVVGPFPAVRGHEQTLGQVLFNLISNGLKFVGPNTRPQLRIRAESISRPPPGKKSSGAEEEWVRVWVEDNGIGIAPEYHGQVFRVFNRLHGENYPGTGIGLAIVQKGIERMGGRVGMDSVAGRGSQFWFELRKA